MSVSPPEHAARDAAWHAVAAAFAALGRAVLLLDERFAVVRASPKLDKLLCEGAADRIVGHDIDELVGGRLFAAGAPAAETLARGGRVEGRRAFIRCQQTGAQLVGVSVAPLSPEVALPLHPRARYMLVVRAPDSVEVSPNARRKLVAKSPEMLRIIGLIEALSESEATILITGETGVGKGAVAAAVHDHSPRRDGAFVTVDAGAIPGELLESELFGHVRGAFTGAHKDRVGQIELARGGTLFLDEIGDLPLSLQSKLLRVVQEREYRRLGESAPRAMDARIIAATNIDLAAAVAAGRFREDLYYRLRVVPIHIPPLRERADEIARLASYLLDRIGASVGRVVRVSVEAVEVLARHPWPGNVRQLENALEYAVAICRGPTILPEHLPAEVQDPTVARPPGAAAPPPSAPAPRPATRPPAPAAAAPEDAETERILAALERHRWNRGAAAEALGISRTTLWRRMRQLGID